MTLEQAQQALYPLGIEIGEASYEQSDEPLDADRIFEQSVAPQETVKNGQRVTIKLVSPDPQAQMPSVMGMQLEAAKELLEQNHLTVGSVSQIIADDIVEGAVVEQSLEEGAKVDYGTAVDLIVAAKPDHVYTKPSALCWKFQAVGRGL
jgi:serine/threonine-protein kinase